MPVLERTGTRVLRDTSANVELVVYVGGVATAPDSAPAVTVTQPDGTVLTSGAGSVATPCVFTLSPTYTADVQSLKVTWVGSWGGVAGQTFETFVQVVGGLLFNLAEARAFDNAALTSATDYPTATILAARDRISESFEQVCAVPFGLAYGREVLDGSGDDELWLSAGRVESVRSIKVRTAGTTTWTAYTAGELADVLVERNGRLTRETLGAFLWGRRNIAVEYEYGYQPVPEEIKRASLWLLRDQLAGTDLPRNAISQSSELGTFSLSVPGLRGSYYGLPQVDEVVNRYSRRLPGVG